MTADQVRQVVDAVVEKGFTALKIDVDGAEFGVLKGAEKILGNAALTDIFIEIDHENDGIFGFLEARGFSVSWRHNKPQNADVLFTR